MKNIIKAMSEKTYKPRPKWWGFVKDGHRYLMRYHHCFAIFTQNEVVYYNYETITDKRGVMFAIKYFEENKDKINFI
jgi:regulation of enolase protein 1 (concanavalin A-like superfamily)